jgi:hypothetical protein
MQNRTSSPYSAARDAGGAPRASLRSIGYNWSYLPCRLGHLVPIWQPGMQGKAPQQGRGRERTGCAGSGRPPPLACSPSLSSRLLRCVGKHQPGRDGRATVTASNKATSVISANFYFLPPIFENIQCGKISRHVPEMWLVEYSLLTGD